MLVSEGGKEVMEKRREGGGAGDEEGEEGEIDDQPDQPITADIYLSQYTKNDCSFSCLILFLQGRKQ